MTAHRFNPADSAPPGHPQTKHEIFPTFPFEPGEAVKFSRGGEEDFLGPCSEAEGAELTRPAGQSPGVREPRSG